MDTFTIKAYANRKNHFVNAIYNLPKNRMLRKN